MAKPRTKQICDHIFVLTKHRHAHQVPIFHHCLTKNTQLDTGKYVTHNSRTTCNLALSIINGLAMVMLKSLCGTPQRINVSHDIIRKSTTLAINALNSKIFTVIFRYWSIKTTLRFWEFFDHSKQFLNQYFEKHNVNITTRLIRATHLCFDD